MENIRSVLSQYTQKGEDKEVQKTPKRPESLPLSSEIPDLFFDEVLHRFKLNRSEIILLMCLYRQVWCRPNLYHAHGIGPLNSYAELSTQLQFSHEELVNHLRSLENYGLIETVRSGQYFVRKYFIQDLDEKYGQNYDEFF